MPRETPRQEVLSRACCRRGEGGRGIVVPLWLSACATHRCGAGPHTAAVSLCATHAHLCRAPRRLSALCGTLGVVVRRAALCAMSRGSSVRNESPCEKGSRLTTARLGVCVRAPVHRDAVRLAQSRPCRPPAPPPPPPPPLRRLALFLPSSSSHSARR
jgi:hypothetical protein